MTSERQVVDPASFRGYRFREVRRLVAEVLEEEGFVVEVLPDHVRTADGREFGLQTLLGRCARASPVHWRRVVIDQIRSMLGACRPELLDGLDLPGAAGRVFPRVIDGRIVPPGMAHLEYARPVCGDLTGAGPGGGPPRPLAPRLRARPPRRGRPAGRGPAEPGGRSGHQQRKLALKPGALKPGALVHVLEGGGHTASQVVRLADVLRRVLGTDDFPGGVLVAIPTKYEMWLHPITDHTAYAAYFGLYDEAVRAYAEDPGPLSPYVYWWRGGELVQIMTGRAGLPHVDDEFVRSTARIAEASDSDAAIALVAALGNERREESTRRQPR